MIETLLSTRIGVIGLGYVGLPLAVEFGKQYDTVGFDINATRVAALRSGHDSTLEVDADALATASRLRFTSALDDLRDCTVYIVTVPTPIDSAKRPDLTPLIRASETIGSILKAGDTVIYESTVYPGCTEEVCVPILERTSGLRYDSSPPALKHTSLPPLAGEGARRADGGAPATHASTLAPPSLAGQHRQAPALDPAPTENRTPKTEHSSSFAENRKPKTENSFTVGYSPERINPGDKSHRLTSILKVTSGSTPEAADFIDALYATIIKAGTHKVSSIKVAEAAKVIENTQRDLNIALVNDLAILFNKLGIDTLEVLEAAGTKWNFLPFRPGLVGGHCISVDPYYLTHKAQQVGHHSDVILAGRRTNDAMAGYVADQVIRLMVQKAINPVQARVLVLGLAFKENCPDLRNTRVVDIVSALQGYNTQVDVYDPWVDKAEAHHEYNITPIDQPGQGSYDAIILAVGHAEFADLGAHGIRALGKPTAVLYDVKSLLPRSTVDGRL